MKRITSFFLALLLTLCLFACGSKNAEHTFKNAAELSSPVFAKPVLHSPFYIHDVPVEDVILYFNEVCLDSEFTNSGDPSVIQKWTVPIYYTVEGEYTSEDIAVFESFTAWLNGIEGFPGIFEADDISKRNLRICFCAGEAELVNIMGTNFYGMDGGVTFWYMYNEIYDATICYRTDIPQYTRNSVIIEELYNGLGPVQDTALREDSIIYSGFSEPQWLSETDCLIMRLLYHPDIKPGMSAHECEAVIRTLYW